MAPQEQLVKGLREAFSTGTHCVELKLDDPQSWPAILTYAETIEADDPDKAEDSAKASDD